MTGVSKWRCPAIQIIFWTIKNNELATVQGVYKLKCMLVRETRFNNQQS